MLKKVKAGIQPSPVAPQGFCDPISLLVSCPKTDSCICWVLLLCRGGGEPKTTLRLEDSLLIKELPGLGEAVRHTVMAHFRAWLWGEMGTGWGESATSRESPRSCRGLLPVDMCRVTIQGSAADPASRLLHGPRSRCLKGLHSEGFSSEFLASLYQACL